MAYADGRRPPETPFQNNVSHKKEWEMMGEIEIIKRRLAVIEAALGIPQRLTFAQERVAQGMVAVKEKFENAQSKVEEYSKLFEKLEAQLIKELFEE
jgi:hypothetical protein